MNILSRLFPTPKSVTLATVGLDFSDATMRFVDFKVSSKGLLPKRFAQTAIPEGCMKGGRINDIEKFTSFLKEVKNTHKIKYARVSIPESQVYSFTLSLDKEASSDIRGAIEFLIEDNIPLKSIETVFDYHVLNSSDTKIIVQVVAISESVANDYFQAFFSAGIIPVSFELEGQAISRAVLKPTDTGSCMVVDFGANRTGITIVTNRTAVVTTTIDFGGKILTEVLSKELSISFEEAELIKINQGLNNITEHKNVLPLLLKTIAPIKDEINRRYVYWHENKEQFDSFPNIDTIYLCGGHSNLPGLADYLSKSLKLKVVQVNPWANCFSIEDIVPEMSYKASMSYVTAIGLALADYIYD